MSKSVKSWQAWKGTVLVHAGWTRAGRERRVLCTEILVAHTKSDAAALSKTYPRLKFVERTR